MAYSGRKMTWKAKFHRRRQSCKQNLSSKFKFGKVLVEIAKICTTCEQFKTFFSRNFA